MAILAPSILSADFSKLGEDVQVAEKAGAEILHIDVMDGHFVPNISFGPYVMKCLEGKTKLPFDVHLMIENADDYISEFVTSQTEYITVHYESCIHLHRTIQSIKALGVKAGVAVNPATNISLLEDILGEVDLVLVMSVNPGFGGQSFISNALTKIRKLDKIRKDNGYGFLIEIDGGAGASNVYDIVNAGCDIVVAGSAVFKGNIADNVMTISENMNK